MNDALLAIDSNSRSAGFMFGGPADSHPRGGSWTLPGGDQLQRSCGSLCNSIVELSKVIKPRYIVAEAVPPVIDAGHAARTSFVLTCLYGSILTAGHIVGAQVIPANIRTWRKHFLGKGNLPGPEAKRMTMARCKQFGWSAANDDEADACGIWSWGMATYYPRWQPKSAAFFPMREAQKPAKASPGAGGLSLFAAARGGA